MKPEDVQASLRAIVETVTDTVPGGHILTGPVFVEGAEPGDALEVRILSIDLPIPYGYNGCSGFIRENCNANGRTIILPLDRERMTATFAPGIVIPLKPFFGSMGVAPPPEAGRVSSNPPGTHAGNLDNRELVAGTTLLIPVHVAGALFEVGDGHAAQGDGEVDQTAIETSLRGRLQLTVRKDMKLAWPRAETSTDYISMGTDEDLTKATRRRSRRWSISSVQTRGMSHGRLSVDEHRGKCGGDAARGREGGRPREDAEGYFHRVANRVLGAFQRFQRFEGFQRSRF